VGGGGSTVVGEVVDSYGQPVPNRTVVQAGRSTTTSAGGCFTFTGVTAPYDVSIVQTTPSKFASVYTQLTRTDPKLQDLSVTGTPAHSTTVGGTLGGTPIPGPDGTQTGVGFGSPEASAGNFFQTGSWSLNVSWAGPASTTGGLHALQWTVDANGTVTGYLAYGVRTGLTLSSGTPISNANLTLTTPVNTAAVTGSIALPSGYTISSRNVYLTFGDAIAFPVSSDAITSPSFGIPVPSGVGAAAIVSVTADNGTSQSTAQTSALAPGTLNATLTLPSPAQPTSPASGATGVDTTTAFVWTPIAGGLSLLILNDPSGSGPEYVIVSGGSTTHIPDLSAQGLGLPSGAPYHWTLIGLGPLASVDALAATGLLPSEGVGYQTTAVSDFTTR